jgi:hypothetical protein
MTEASKIRIGPPKIINVHALWASTYLWWGLQFGEESDISEVKSVISIQQAVLQVVKLE